MGTGTASQQMKDAVLFVDDMLRPMKNSTRAILFSSATALGGSTAGMASYVFGFDAYTYNGFSIVNMFVGRR